MQRVILMAFLLSACGGEDVGSASKTLITEYSLNTGEDFGFVLYGGDRSVIRYSPNQTGWKVFRTWHDTIINWDKVAFVSYHWRDYSNPDNSWNQWKTGDAPFWFFGKQETWLYSGSPTIEYKFVYDFYDAGDFPLLTIRAEAY